MKTPSVSVLRDYRRRVEERIAAVNVRRPKGVEGRLLLVSKYYNGYWLEHLYDAIVLGKLYPEYKDISASQVKLFCDHVRTDGQIPYVLRDNELREGTSGVTAGYSQLQECVSFASLALEAWELSPDAIDLDRLYQIAVGWDGWLCRHRMTRGLGLVETFCGFDTGHDASPRVKRLRYVKAIEADNAAAYPEGCAVAPVIMPDLNAVMYGNRMAMSKMAAILGKSEESRLWKSRAEDIKTRLIELCYDKNDAFFYDLDKNGEHSRIKSVAITALFAEGFLSQDMADEIYERHLANPEEFATPYPFPSIAMNDPAQIKGATGNCWGYFSQGLTALRSMRWMKRYGREVELHKIMRAWISAMTADGVPHFSQELDPVTGVPTPTSEWYSSSMLFYLAALSELEIC